MIFPDYEVVNAIAVEDSEGEIERTVESTYPESHESFNQVVVIA